LDVDHAGRDHQRVEAVEGGRHLRDRRADLLRRANVGADRLRAGELLGGRGQVVVAHVEERDRRAGGVERLGDRRPEARRAARPAATAQGLRAAPDRYGDDVLADVDTNRPAGSVTEIVRVHAYPLCYPEPHDSMRNRYVTPARFETDAGGAGWGECISQWRE